MASGKTFSEGGGGGGYLNGVAAVITGYKFVERGPYKGNDGGTFSVIDLTLEFRRDGASEVQTRRLKVGQADEFNGISADGQTLLIKKPIYGKSEAGLFLSSLGAKDSNWVNYPDVDGEAHYSPMVGLRVKFAMLPKANGQTEVGSDGKTYPKRDLYVDEVLGSGAGTANVTATSKAQVGANTQAQLRAAALKAARVPVVA